MGTDHNNEGDQNVGPILSLLWTRVHEIMRLYRGPIVLSNALAQFSVSYFSEDIRH